MHESAECMRHGFGRTYCSGWLYIISDGPTDTYINIPQLAWAQLCPVLDKPANDWESGIVCMHVNRQHKHMTHTPSTMCMHLHVYVPTTSLSRQANQEPKTYPTTLLCHETHFNLCNATNS